MTVNRAGSGFAVRVTVINPGGIAGTLTMTANADGVITYHSLAGKDTITVQAQRTSNGIGQQRRGGRSRIPCSGRSQSAVAAEDA